MRRQDRRRRPPALIASLGLLLLMTGCAMTIPAKGDVPLAQVDLPRMYGGWYIVATIPNALEHKVIAATTTFRRRPAAISARTSPCSAAASTPKSSM